MKAVSAAVFYAASRLYTKGPVQWQETDAGAVFYIPYKDVITQVFVLHVSDYVASVRIHVVAIWEPYDAEFWMELLTDDRVVVPVAMTLQVIDHAVSDLLRAGVKIDDLKPPIPPASDWQLIFHWQRLYHPTMTDDELARLIGLEPQTVRNERSRLGLAKRDFSERVSLDKLRQRFAIREAKKQNRETEKVRRGRRKH
jgi:hypothetical protein